uniref:Uncharacterized protein n=1 Tax=Tanacetum cinerariifolium TaxID=118510 RepID=A0A6L2K958_TANCI|nr:hypothetical protein [Tanacetum cinerariifolium]
MIISSSSSIKHFITTTSLLLSATNHHSLFTLDCSPPRLLHSRLLITSTPSFSSVAARSHTAWGDRYDKWSIVDDRNSDDERTKGCGVDSDAGGGAWAREVAGDGYWMKCPIVIKDPLSQEVEKAQKVIIISLSDDEVLSDDEDSSDEELTSDEVSRIADVSSEKEVYVIALSRSYDTLFSYKHAYLLPLSLLIKVLNCLHGGVTSSDEEIPEYYFVMPKASKSKVSTSSPSKASTLKTSKVSSSSASKLKASTSKT